MGNYKQFKNIFQSSKLPLAIVDLDLFNQNAEQLAKRAKGKPIRLATKSIRCVDLIKLILQLYPNTYKGLMCFYPDEANKLFEAGLDDILIAYPYARTEDLQSLIHWIKLKKKLYLMVDHADHLRFLNDFAKSQNIQINICLDFDMTTKHFGIYFGVYRSNLKSKAMLEKFWETYQKCPHLKIKAVMGYEAQIAGVGDNKNKNSVYNLVVRFLKRKSEKSLQKRRQQLVDWLQSQNIILDFVNGGGTGSLESTIRDSSITEVTIGSGLYSPTLFDFYKNFKHQPSAFFALEITRTSENNFFTLAGGGYIASGSPGIEKIPSPFLPENIELIKNEMCGEVQTPFFYKGPEVLKIGDPIFFRHAKAGELCERFNQLHLIQDKKIVNIVKTYRGEGWCFL